MNFKKLTNSINTKIDTSHYRHLIATLHTLVEYDLISEDTLRDDLTTNFDGTLKKYKDILTSNGNSDLRGSISKARRL
jgi:hypothetical protein